ncbi:MAG: hypothetical protein OFPII_09300 [Osedax symbiont Rs1]|nr:MAG: hypothetical protein OFPII_09300 [Osedax symbiont Rs1]
MKTGRQFLVDQGNLSLLKIIFIGQLFNFNLNWWLYRVLDISV